MQMHSHGVAVSPATESLASGQRLAILAILISIANLGVIALVPPVGHFIALGAAVLMMVAVWRLGAGLGIVVPLRVGLMVLMLIPLVSLLVLVLLNQRAIRDLRTAGYQVGFFGVKP